MKSGTGIADTRTVRDYIHTVARSVHADSIDWWDTDGIEAVLVLPLRLHYLPGRNAVLAWNRTFGWSLGVEGLGRRSVIVIDGLGVGRMPSPAVCAERAVELIDDYCRSTPALPGAQVAASTTADRCPRIGRDTAGSGRRDRVVRRP
ncbi:MULTISPECIES: DUF6292 family protein [Rhodococcus]|uniref:DUF6292 domain-containing protein n=1 Tax=Rhodococcus opacus TaxID=37919 RepID=A0A076EFC9_RHOOP|nr:DUF6292 family protein [Rhodococcus opacus]AII03788.1 hypothetical protein EP51_03835 [Rhodococcus opacus]